MPIDIDALRDWFLGTVTGVLLLGAIGSIIGALLLAALRWSFPKTRIREMMMAVAYRFLAREVAILAVLRKQHDEQAEASAYLLTVMGKLLNAVIDSVIFIMALVSTAAVGVVYGLDRPRLLSSAVAVLLMSFWMWLKSLATMAILTKSSVTDVERHMQATVPKKWRHVATGEAQD